MLHMWYESSKSVFSVYVNSINVSNHCLPGGFHLNAIIYNNFKNCGYRAIVIWKYSNEHMYCVYLIQV